MAMSLEQQQTLVTGIIDTLEQVGVDQDCLNIVGEDGLILAGAEDKFANDLGMDSLDMVEFIMKLKQNPLLEVILAGFDSDAWFRQYDRDALSVSLLVADVLGLLK